MTRKRGLRWPVLVGLAVLSFATVVASSSQGGGAPPKPESAVSREDAKQVFERFKSQAGRWEGRSTAGWEGALVVSVIARGSAVLSASSFKDEPQEGMATLIHMDGERLMLTHYCEAGNQPRLVLSSVEDAGQTVTFTFLDGTNLASRDRGHMDSVVFRFVDEDNYTSRWSWYSKGRETWFEEIRYSRVPRAAK